MKIFLILLNVNGKIEFKNLTFKFVTDLCKTTILDLVTKISPSATSGKWRKTGLWLNVGALGSVLVATHMPTMLLMLLASHLLQILPSVIAYFAYLQHLPCA